MLVQVSYITLINILLTLIDNEIIFNANSAVNRNINLSSVISPVNPFVKPNITKSTDKCSGLTASTVSVSQEIKLQNKEENIKVENYSEMEESDNEEEENNFFLKSKSIVLNKSEQQAQINNYIPIKNDAPKDPRKKFKKK